jgi:Fur family ferric uptake transcriptional regulator
MNNEYSSNSDSAHRMTRQRQRILEAVNQLAEHPTADEVYQLVRRELPRISLGTVYRNLDVLAEQGLIAKLQTGPQMRFDSMVAAHVHIRCLRCGALADADTGELPDLDSALLDASGYRLLGHHLEYVGVCPSCQAEETATP